MNKLLTIAALAAILISPTADADSLKKGALGCLSENLLDQLTTVIVEKDQRAVRHLLDSGCLKTSQAAPITVLNAGILSGKSKVRAYAGGSSVELWVYSEDIIERDVSEPQQQKTPRFTGTSPSLATKPFASYFDPEEGIEHTVERYRTQDHKDGFEFEPPLPRQDDVLIDAAAWIILSHFRDSKVADTVRYFTDGDLMFVRDGKRYRVQLIPIKGDTVRGLLFEEQ